MKRMLTAWLVLFSLAILAVGQQDEAWYKKKKKTFVSSGAGVTWTLRIHPSNYTCSFATVSTASCSLTATTVANDGLILASSMFALTASSHVPPSLLSASGDSTWTHCPSCGASIEYTTNTYEVCDAYYIPVATGVTSGTFTITWTIPAGAGANGNIDVELYDVVRSTGSPSLDTSNNATQTSATPTGPSLSLTGTSDFIANWGGFEQTPSGPGAPWTNPNDVDSVNVFGVFVGALNRSSGAAVSYSQSPSGGAAMCGIALK